LNVSGALLFNIHLNRQSNKYLQGLSENHIEGASSSCTILKIYISNCCSHKKGDIRNLLQIIRNLCQQIGYLI